MIQRYNLQPRDPEAYQRGELVEPVKQIVYYIDSATPVKWRPYMIRGVEKWQKAFEAAGFKNAILALVLAAIIARPKFGKGTIFPAASAGVLLICVAIFWSAIKV